MEGPDTDDGVLKPGDRVTFSFRNLAVTKRILGEGWADQEGSHVWSIGETADLFLRLSPSVKSIVVRCSGNPFVNDPINCGVEVAVDDQSIARYTLEQDRTSDLTIPCSSKSMGCTTKVTFCPFLRMNAAHDQRMLGICLIALECI